MLIYVSHEFGFTNNINGVKTRKLKNWYVLIRTKKFDDFEKKRLTAIRKNIEKKNMNEFDYKILRERMTVNVYFLWHCNDGSF